MKAKGASNKAFYKRKRYIFLFLLLIALVLPHIFMTFRSSDRETRAYFKELHTDIKIDYFKSKATDRDIRVVATGFDKDQSVIFIHGSPGSGNAFYRYLNNDSLHQKANIITYDRPGYGYSGFGDAVTEITTQSEVVAELIAQYNLTNVVLVGHSYGGTIAAYAPLLSKNIKATLLIAPALDPDLEKYYWAGNFTQWQITRWLIPTSWNVSGDEKYSHAEALIKHVNDWQLVSVPVLMLQGDQDMLVPFENLEFAESHFNPEYFTGKTLKGENHFTPWTKEKLVIENILTLMN
ncbi:Pimeloyl-ACP methyl ester carboxylesterase [Zhouia amylolytica]|uniref:Pimeloyl-ACP methyl ester carboxylesterase n=2 Tax=Zhouia amylolytica TaxID=376730 RepID=A0A1I6SB21_9FLAO|nr:Pimeloyl-ACP methyl ester carboxylesterase [Zhouia amylolytica]